MMRGKLQKGHMRIDKLRKGKRRGLNLRKGERRRGKPGNSEV